METMCRSSGKCPRAPCARGLMSWCGTISGAARRTTGSRAFACFLTPPRFSRIPQRSSHAPRREKLFKEAFCNTFVQRQTLAFNVFDFPLTLKNPRSLALTGEKAPPLSCMSKDRWLGGAPALVEAAAKIGLRLLNLEVACRFTVRVQEQLPQDAGHGCSFLLRAIFDAGHGCSFLRNVCAGRLH